VVACDQVWPSKVSASGASSPVPEDPTAVHDVALKQLTPDRKPPPVGVGTVVAAVQADPFQVWTTLLLLLPLTAAQKLGPAHDTAARL
jgi:hypothetical protein